MELTPIAHIRSDFSEKFGIPRQSGLVEELTANVVFTPEFRDPAALRGIGGWTAQYVAMRTMGWPDAFLETDAGVKHALPDRSAKELLALAEKIDAPIGCSLMGVSGIPTDHPRFLGMQGMHGHYACSTAMHRSDCIIALGTRFNDRVTGDRTKFAKGAKLVQIDVDGSELSKNVAAVCGMRGDVKLTLQRLVELVSPAEHPEWRGTVEGFQSTEAEGRDVRTGLTPRNALLTLDRHLTEATPVATDVGQHQMWAAHDPVLPEAPAVHFQRRAGHHGLRHGRGHGGPDGYRGACRAGHRGRQLRHEPQRAGYRRDEPGAPGDSPAQQRRAGHGAAVADAVL